MINEITENHIIDNSIFRIWDVIEIIGQSVKVKIDSWKNTSSILYKWDIIQNISVWGYIKIKKGFEVMIWKIEWESVKESKINSNTDYSSSKEKIYRILEIKILGFFEWKKFKRWIKELPLIDNTCYLLTKKEFDKIHDFIDDREKDEPLEIWTLEYDFGQKIELWINKLFASHIWIFWNTWSWKSYILAKIYRELFKKFQKKDNFKKNSDFFIIDINWEYIWEIEEDWTYKNRNVITDEQYKNIYVLSTENEDWDKIEIAKETLNDSIFWSILLEATEKTQSPFLNDTLKNNSYLDKIFINWNIQSNIKWEIINIIKKWVKREDKNLWTKIFTEMFSKLYKCVDVSYVDKIQEIKSTIESYLNFNWTTWSYYCNVFDDDWVLTSTTYDSTIINETFFEKINILLNDIIFNIWDIKVIRLRIILSYYWSIINWFWNREHIAGLIKRVLDDRIENLDKVIKIWVRPKTKNITIVSLKDVKIWMRKMIPMLLVKELYEQKKKDNNKNKSLHIIIEEAHNILSENSNRENEEWKDYRLETFEEIIKEWRKFWTFLTIASQRPSDISSTIISQLHNYFLHRLINEYDLKAVEKTIAYLDKVSADSIPNLATWTCILAWLIAQIPAVMKVWKITNIENQPQSHTIDLLSKWKD